MNSKMKLLFNRCIAGISDLALDDKDKQRMRELEALDKVVKRYMGCQGDKLYWHKKYTPKGQESFTDMGCEPIKAERKTMLITGSETLGYHMDILHLTFTTISGQHSYRHNINLGSSNEIARSMALRQLSAIAKACGKSQITKPEELYNIPISVTLKQGRMTGWDKVLNMDFSEIERCVAAHYVTDPDKLRGLRQCEKQRMFAKMYGGTVTGRFKGSSNHLEDASRYWAVWDHKLSDKEIESFTKDPYQMLHKEENKMSEQKDQKGTIIDVRYWVDTNGHRHELKDMGTGHIWNCVKMLGRWTTELKEVKKTCGSTRLIERKIADHTRCANAFLKELKSRGE